MLLEGCGSIIHAFDVVDLEAREDSAQGRDYERVIEELFGVLVSEQRRWRGEHMIVLACPGPPRTRTLGLPEELDMSTHAIRDAQKVFPRRAGGKRLA